MIFKRAIAKLRAQDWTAIAIELAIVVLGVFFGTWVANWNQGRQAQRQTRQTLFQLGPELRQLEEFSSSARVYYAAAQRYADTAFAGWSHDPKVSDRQFVIAAYQASQIYGFNNNGASWSLVFGASDLRNITDLAARQALTRLMTFDYSTINLAAVATKYRDDVREVIPNEVQVAIRDGCGDKVRAGGRTVSMSSTCDIALEPNLVADTARALRDQPQLPKELAQHQSAVNVYLTNLQLFDAQEQLLAQRIRLLRR